MFSRPASARVALAPAPSAPVRCTCSPHAREETWRVLEARGPPSDADFTGLGGDFNTPFELPRTFRGKHLANDINGTLTQHNLLDVNGSRPTHRAAHSEAALDVPCMAAAGAAIWDPQQHWRPTLSDLAWLQASRRPTRATSGRACTIP